MSRCYVSHSFEGFKFESVVIILLLFGVFAGFETDSLTLSHVGSCV